MDARSLAPLERWRGRRLGPVEVLADVDSTTLEALRRLDRGEGVDGIVLVAERQSAGRGSRGRTWHHVPGRSLALTALLRWPDPATLHRATWAAVLSAVDVAAGAGLSPTVKWPNDALAGGRKFAGVLVESRSLPEVTWAALGIGLNALQSPADFVGEFRRPPTSLAAEGVALALGPPAPPRRARRATRRRRAGRRRDAGGRPRPAARPGREGGRGGAPRSRRPRPPGRRAARWRASTALRRPHRRTARRTRHRAGRGRRRRRPIR
jgi:hypothetical protein